MQVAKRTYQMTEKEAEGLLDIASSRVPFGIYALRIGNHIELRNDRLTRTQLKKRKQEYRRRGVKVYANGL